MMDSGIITEFGRKHDVISRRWWMLLLLMMMMMMIKKQLLATSRAGRRAVCRTRDVASKSIAAEYITCRRI